MRGELHHGGVSRAVEGGGALDSKVVCVNHGTVIAQSLIVVKVVQVTCYGEGRRRDPGEGRTRLSASE